MALRDNIKRFRKQKGWSQTELAEKIGFASVTD
jgi:transcriptional regulator with XRE-family HTH domain